MAHPRGFEPPTCRLGGGRSILLSYGCISLPIVAEILLPVNVFISISANVDSYESL